MLNNKKGFTLIELIAVVVIMAIIALIATPNIISMIDTGKKEQYVADAKEFISKATYMYKQDKYKNDTALFVNGSKIFLINIKDVKEQEDPYGYEYILSESYVTITQTLNASGIATRTPSIYLKSCKRSDETNALTNECHYIGTDGAPVSSADLSIDSVK